MQEKLSDTRLYEALIELKIPLNNAKVLGVWICIPFAGQVHKYIVEYQSYYHARSVGYVYTQARTTTTRYAMYSKEEKRSHNNII